ncbi:MAG: response regulator [Planctomycetes bacterium]|nr:response regulator [Planctomycetota bacterium]
MTEKPRILCVDDESRVLIGLSVLLRREFEVVTSESSAKALETLADGSFAVLLSDMRMPGMSGADLLLEASRIAPDTTRVVLSGQTDLQDALIAVNRCGAFRILRKPCDQATLIEALHDGVRAHKERVSERELSEKALLGTVRLLMDVFALTNPVAFGHANQVNRHISMLATALNYPNAWELEIAGMLLQVGTALLAPTTIEKLYHGETLNEVEARELARGPKLIEELFQSVPRLGGVQALVHAFQNARELVPEHTVELPKDRVLLGAGILRLSQDFERLEWRGLDRTQVFELLHARPRGYALQLVDRFRAALEVRESFEIVEERSLNELLPGMVLVEDLLSRSGALLARKGHEITMSFVDGVRANRFKDVVEPIRVIIGRRVEPAQRKIGA